MLNFISKQRNYHLNEQLSFAQLKCSFLSLPQPPAQMLMDSFDECEKHGRKIPSYTGGRSIYCLFSELQLGNGYGKLQTHSYLFPLGNLQGKEKHVQILMLFIS